MRSKKDYSNLIGNKYNRLKVLNIEFIKNKKGYNEPYAISKCECGRVTRTKAYKIAKELVLSCGCFKKNSEFKTKSIVYPTWHAMINRVTPKYHRAHRYYYRGIDVCNDWKNKNNGFKNFENWALNNGFKEGLQLDRIDNNKGYYPNNCRFVTPRENSNNKENQTYITIEGETLTVAQWAYKYNITSELILPRLERGWEGKRLLDPPKQPKLIELEGISLTITEWAKKLNVSRHTLKSRYRAGHRGKKLLKEFKLNKNSISESIEENPEIETPFVVEESEEVNEPVVTAPEVVEAAIQAVEDAIVE